MYLKKGDNVIVISGKDKGKKGKIDRVLRDFGSVVVEGVNLKKRHQKSKQRGENKKGRIVEVSSPIDASNVSLIDPKSGKPSRIGMKTNEKGVKVRIAKKSGEEIS